MTVKVTGLGNAKRKVEVRLWNSKNGIPKDDSKAFRRATVDIVDGGATTTFPDVPFGEYAVSAYHDENSNGKLDTRSLVSRSSVPVSNDTHKKFGPPPFDSSRFSIREPQTMVPIAIEY